MSLAAIVAALFVPFPSAEAQGWWIPWGDQRQPVPREPVRPQAPPVQVPPPPPAYSPAPSYGQSSSTRAPICVQLEQRLVQESRSSQAADVLPRLENDIRQAQRTMQTAQGQLDRNNCYEYEFLMFGKSLKRDPACRNLAGQVETAKRRVGELEAQRQQIVQSGGRSLRDDIVRELARNNCGPQYQQEASRSSGPFSSLWQDEDGGTGGYRYGALPYATFRTVCVRLCDGAFFPISFSTLPNHFERDQDLCQQKCAAPAELYYHSQSQGQGIEQAISHKTKQPYSTLRTAFRFRKEFVAGCSCKQAEFSPQPTTPAPIADRRADAATSAGGQVPPLPPRR